jgi:hypothetical protein
MLESNGSRIGAAATGVAVAVFTVIAAAIDLATAWTFVWVSGLFIATLVISWGGTELVAGVCDWGRKPVRKIATSAAICAVPVTFMAPELRMLLPGGYRGVAVFGMFLCAIPPALWMFIPALRNAAFAELARQAGTAARGKLVKAPGKPQRELQPGEEKQDGEVTVGAWSKDTPDDDGTPPAPPQG